MRTLFRIAPFGRSYRLGAWVQDLPPPPTAAAGGLNACPIPGHPDYFSLRFADGDSANGLVVSSPLTRAEIENAAAGRPVAYPGGCPPLAADVRLYIECNDGPDKHGFYDIISNRFFLTQEGQYPSPHPLCPPPGGTAPTPTPTPA